VETTVLREAGFYAALDEGGREVAPTLIDSVQDRDGRLIYTAPALTCQGCDDPAQPPTLVDARRQLADPASAFQVVMMMEGVVQHGTGVPAGQGLGRQIAGKTGTTQDFQDAWFGGFTPDLVTVVWIGFDTPTSLGENETGAALAAPVFHDFMQAALKDRPALAFVPPPGLTVASYDSGFGTVTDAFKPGQAPGASGALGGAATAEAQDSAGDAPPTATTTGSAGSPGGAGTAAATGGTAAGVDSGLGGLY
jgi:penicillin-binding protein 1A